MFCVPGLIFGHTEVVGSYFNVLRARTHFRRYRRRQVSFSCFALSDTFWAVRKESGPFSCFAFPDYVFGDTVGVDSRLMFCAPKLICGGTDGVGSRFHVLHSPTRFSRCGGPQILFSCFALPDSFSAVLRASGPVFTFYAP
jgi:hypothetical protein